MLTELKVVLACKHVFYKPENAKGPHETKFGRS